MRNLRKTLTGVAAAAIVGGVVAAATPASASGAGAIAGAAIGGLVVGGIVGGAMSQPHDGYADDYPPRGYYGQRRGYYGGHGYDGDYGY